MSAPSFTAAANERKGDVRSPGAPRWRGWIDFLRRVKDDIKRDRLSIIAAGVAFYALLALFPALLAFVALSGLFADGQQIERQVASLSNLLPPQAASVVLDQLNDLIKTNRTALGLGAIGGIVLAFWSASAGIRNLMEALNVAYDERETRGFVRFYGTALLLTAGAIVGVGVAIAIVVAVPLVIRLLGLDTGLGAVISYVRWPIVAVCVTLGIAVLYRFGPCRERAPWRWVTRGAVTATALWLAGSAAFSVYVTQFGNFNKTYGSAGALVVLLLWFLLSAYAILIGAEIDAEMERQARGDRNGDTGATAEGRPAQAAEPTDEGR